MEIRKETKWLCENARALERFAGQWVVFDTTKGLVNKGDSLMRLLRDASKPPVKDPPFVFHVPSKTELDAPRLGHRRR